MVVMVNQESVVCLVLTALTAKQGGVVPRGDEDPQADLASRGAQDPPYVTAWSAFQHFHTCRILEFQLIFVDLVFENRVTTARLVSKGNQAPRASQVQRVRTDLLASVDCLEATASLAGPEGRESKVCRVSRDLLVLWGAMALTDRKDSRGSKDPLVPLDCLDCGYIMCTVF